MSHPAPDTSENPPARRWPKRRIAICSVAALTTVGLAVFGEGFLAWGARQMASRRLSVGAVSAAEEWLAWSAWFDPSNGRTDLVRASCLRRRYEESLWNEALEAAQRYKAPPELIQRERQLGRIQAGTFDEAGNELSTLIDAGASPDEVCTAFMHGYLARKDSPRAEMVLEAWAKEQPNSVQLVYMQGVYWQWLADAAGDLARQTECFARAEEEFKNALAQEPRHEPARKALADLLEDQDRLEEARSVYVALAAQAPTRESARLGLARVLRGLGLLGRARSALEPLGLRLEESPAAASEMGQIELESGNYEEAKRWLGLADPETTADADTLRAAATSRAIGGDTVGAERLLSRLDRENAMWARKNELLTRLAIGLHDEKAADELRRLSSANSSLSTEKPKGDSRAAAPASDLYVEQCSGCHGIIGDGNGRGARHLFPRPRNFRAENFRLVSTANRVPTLEDVASVIRRGMPGTSMRAYDELSEDERIKLAREVLQFHREGVREQAVLDFRTHGEEIDEEEVRQIIDLCTTPGDVIRVPRIDPADAGSIARGKDTYFALGCDNCHGDDGTGMWDTPLYDELGRPAPPRDLAHEPLKGGNDPESIYLRLVVGMPGTPHPATQNVSEDRLVELADFCRSLFREPEHESTNHDRFVRASRPQTAWAFEHSP